VKILGIVTRTHDSGLALLKDGVPTIVLEEERFNREKHTRKFPFRSLKAAFDDQGLGVGDIDVITTPWEMKSLRRNLFWVAAEGLPASLNMIPPSARPHSHHDRRHSHGTSMGIDVALRHAQEAAEDRAGQAS